MNIINNKKICAICNKKIKRPLSRYQKYCKECLQLNKEGGLKMTEEVKQESSVETGEDSQQKDSRPEFVCIVCGAKKKRTQKFIDNKFGDKGFTCPKCLKSQEQ